MNCKVSVPQINKDYIDLQIGWLNFLLANKVVLSCDCLPLFNKTHVFEPCNLCTQFESFPFAIVEIGLNGEEERVCVNVVNLNNGNNFGEETCHDLLRWETIFVFLDVDLNDDGIVVYYILESWLFELLLEYVCFPCQPNESLWCSDGIFIIWFHLIVRT
jgi:hypothetical protein